MVCTIFIVDTIASPCWLIVNRSKDATPAKRLDLMEQLIKHPQATFLLPVRGESMKDAGIFDNDVVLVDRVINPRSGHVVVAVVDGEFVSKTLWQRAGRMKLKAANPTFADISPKDGQTVKVWGVVVAAIKQFRI